ncbi:MAG TPA: aminotransferase, partial [Propionibacteriaceae bacterium]|nr:aminotransferase [Propionibacteriaceae bacterium]
VNFNYFIDDRVADYIVEAVRMVAREGWKLLPDYRFDPNTGLWRHHRGPVEPPMRLADIEYAGGRMSYPHHHRRIGIVALRGYLDEAARIFAAATPTGEEGEQGRLSGDSEALRWFDLPAASLDTGIVLDRG